MAAWAASAAFNYKKLLELVRQSRNIMRANGQPKQGHSWISQTTEL